MPAWFPEGDSPAPGDTPQRSLQKINNLAYGGGGGGGGYPAGGNFSNAGDPNGVVTASVGAICVDTTNPGKIWTKTSGTATNTGWTA